jgi:hypothetical protein
MPYWSFEEEVVKPGRRDPTGRCSQLLAAEEAARFCGVVSQRAWWRKNSRGLVPAAVRVGGEERWWCHELCEWCHAFCPPRDEWEFIQRVKKLALKRQQ